MAFPCSFENILHLISDKIVFTAKSRKIFKCDFFSIWRNKSVFISFSRIDKVSVFFNAIMNILFLRCREKVLGINARGIVTCVADAKSFFYFSFMYFVRKSMSSICFSSRNSKDPISTFIFCSSPYPAFSRFMNFLKKSIYWVCLSFCHGSMIQRRPNFIKTNKGD